MLNIFEPWFMTVMTSGTLVALDNTWTCDVFSPQVLIPHVFGTALQENGTANLRLLAFESVAELLALGGHHDITHWASQNLKWWWICYIARSPTVESLSAKGLNSQQLAGQQKARDAAKAISASFETAPRRNCTGTRSNRWIVEHSKSDGLWN